jgi:hypothetical protein
MHDVTEHTQLRHCLNGPGKIFLELIGCTV